MSTHFPYSTRAMQASGRRPSLIGLLLSLALITSWMLWFTLGRITLYATSTTIAITDRGLVTATFPATAREQIGPGQAARVSFDSPENATLGGVLPGEVYRIQSGNDFDSIQVQIWLDEDAPILQRPSTIVSGRVEVAVAQVAPVQLFVQNLQSLVPSPTSRMRTTPAVATTILLAGILVTRTFQHVPPGQ